MASFPPLILKTLLIVMLLPHVWIWGFGKNKVQVRGQDWHFIETEHFRVYFDGNSGMVGEFAALKVEDMYDSLSVLLEHDLNGRIPIILYGIHAEFANTNIIPQILPEGVGGFTEIFRNRVVIPFDGSYPNLEHVLKHEMVHAFMFDMFGELESGYSILQGSLPLWFNEGLAEYASLGWNLGSEMFMLDAVAFGYIPNPQGQLPGFLAYKGGQLFYYYLVQTFGREIVGKLIQAVKRMGNLPDAFRAATGVSLREIGSIWLRELRAIYWPELAKRRYGKVLGRQLTDHVEDLSNFNTRPALSPDGKRLAFFSDREARIGLYIMDVESGRVTRSLIRSGAARGHLTFYPTESGLAWSPDGKKLAFVSQAVGQDVINIIDAGSGNVLEKIVPGPPGILSPDWSQDGRYMTFSGLKDGFSDIYVWDLREKKLSRLTNDIAQDLNPAFSPSGDWIAFESDRAAAVMPQDPKDHFLGLSGLAGHTDIYGIPAGGGEPMKILGGEFDEGMPAFGASDHELAFVSNRSGVNNLYMALQVEGSWTTASLSNLLSGCSSPSLSQGGKRLAFSLFQNQGYDIFIMDNPASKLLRDPLPKTRFMQVLENPSLRLFDSLPPLANLSSFEKEAIVDSFAVVDSAGRTIPPLSDTAAYIQNTDSASGTADITPEDLSQPGAYDIKDYDLEWGLEVAQVNIGFSTFSQNLAGATFLTVSDLLGDHRVSFGLAAGGENFRAIDGAVVYEFLKLRTDYRAFAFHEGNLTPLVGGDHRFDRQWGGGIAAIYPLSIFTRFELGADALFISRGSWRDLLNNDPAYPDFELDILRPGAAWINDNIQWGIVGPIVGRRMRVDAGYVPPVLQDDISFVVADADFRQYWRLFKKYTVAARISAGASEAIGSYSNPHDFLAGGDELIPLFFSGINDENAPDDILDFTFDELSLPLRGFEYYAFRGNRKAISNIEFRFPFVEELRVAWPLSFNLRYLMGTIFADYGGAWSNGNPFDRFGLGYGWGLRLNLGYFVLRYTRAHTFDGLGIGEGDTRNYWSIGAAW